MPISIHEIGFEYTCELLSQDTPKEDTAHNVTHTLGVGDSSAIKSSAGVACVTVATHRAISISRLYPNVYEFTRMVQIRWRGLIRHRIE